MKYSESRRKKIIKYLLTIFFTLILYNEKKCYAGELDFQVITITLHTQPLLGEEIQGKNLEAYPFRLDKRALWMFTPGLQLVYDTRKSPNVKGLSLLYDGFFALSCYGNFAFGGGVGGRYRFLPANRFFIDISVFLNLLIMTKRFQPTHELDTTSMFKGDLAQLGYTLMKDIPDSDYKIIMPLPVYFNFGCGYITKKGVGIGLGIALAGIQVLSNLNISVPILKE